jgi:uncharacterized protein
LKKFNPAPYCIIFLIVLPFLSCNTARKTAQTQTQKPETYNSLLWQISGNGLKQPSYLFGTVHLIPASDYFFSDLAQACLKKSKQLCLEINADDPEMVTAAYKAYMPEGMHLNKLMPESEYKLLKERLKAQGLSIELVKNMKPILISSLLIARGSTVALMTYETELMLMAKAQKKPITSLESPLMQMAALDSIPYAEQAEMLVQTLHGGTEELADLIKHYKTQNIDTLHHYICINTNTNHSDAFNRVLLTNRNNAWLPLIAKNAAEKSTFFAIGAGHLGGSDGLVRLLRKQGYILKPLL